jgi:5,5'-dehydrodivanillate O-demethylase
VQRFLGLYWAYFGPEPAPIITPFDIWMRRDGHHGVAVYPVLDCNWLQSMENSVDPAHLQILHQGPAFDGRPLPGGTRGRIDTVSMEDVQLVEMPYGIMKIRPFKSGFVDAHPLLFPNNLRQSNSTQFRVPIDDTHTWHVHILFDPTDDGSIVDQAEDDIPVEYYEPFKHPVEKAHPEVRFRAHVNLAQDHMAWETQGPIAPRTTERLATSDRGIEMYRQMLIREVRKVQEGIEPIGVYHDGAPVVDTRLAEALNGPQQRVWTVMEADRRAYVGLGPVPGGGQATTAEDPRAIRAR